MPLARKKEDPSMLAAKRQSAAYMDTVNKLGRSEPDLPAAEVDRRALEANDLAVYGFDAKRDRHGNFIQQGIGAPGRESANHFAAIRRYQGEAAWKEAVLEIQKRDPGHHERLGLPKLKETT